MYRKRAYFLPASILILAILACGSQSTGTPGANGGAAQTAVAQTVTAMLQPPAPANTATKPPVTATVSPPTDTPIPATVAIPTDTLAGSPTQVCDNAKFISETIPDGTSEPAGVAFTKTWRFKNTGSCTWNTAYAVVFVSGDAMNAPSAVPFTGNVAPGQEVDVAVNMQAPAAPGDYTGAWTLRNASGVLFGLGAANGPFWIKIKVVAPSATAVGPIVILPVPSFTLLPASNQVLAQVSVAASGSGNVEAACPSGSIVTGGGFAGSSSLQVYTLFSKSNGWLAAAQNLSASVQGLNAYAECLSHTTGSTQQVFAQVTTAAGGVGHAIVNCPSGSVITGGGFGSNTNLAVYTNSATGNGWEVYAKNTSSSNELLNVYAICLSGTSGSTQQVLNQVSAAGNGTGHAVAACPSGTYLTGGGYAGNLSLFVYNESATGSNWQVYARNTSGTSQLLNSYAICLKLP
jgi:hypothetical protein